MENFINYLSSFAPLSEATIQDLKAKVQYFEFEKNHIILDKGKVCNWLYFVNEGLLRQYYLQEDKQITDYFAYENKIAGGVGSVFSRKPSMKIIETIERSSVYGISIDNLNFLFEKHHDFEKVGRLLAIEAFILMENRVFSLQFHSATQRYHDLKTAHPQIIRRASLGHIASYLGITQVSLSRIRSQK